jgi:hypothetical protein
MSRSDGVSPWTATVSTQLPHLSRPQATVLALWSYGMVVTQSCGSTTVATFLACLLHKRPGTVRQQLREWCYAAEDKTGGKRRELEVPTCFGPLVGWVLAWWAPTERRLVLAMDATTLGQRFTVLVISVVYRGCAIPVAWRVVGAPTKGAWRPHWEALFTQVQGSVPAEWTVLVLADRGLSARWLFRHIGALGWHPFLRINQQGQCRPLAAPHFRSLSTIVPQVGTRWSGQVDCFLSPGSQLRCTLVACWEAPHTAPWLLRTDLPPAVADAAWDSVRTWIECGFRSTKRGGWPWQQTKMTDPARASRLWLARAVATLWVVSVGGEADATLPASSLEELPLLHVARRRARRAARPRLLRCFRRGVLTILAALLQGDPLPLGRFLPEPWPCSTPGVPLSPPLLCLQASQAA